MATRKNWTEAEKALVAMRAKHKALVARMKSEKEFFAAKRLAAKAVKVESKSGRAFLRQAAKSGKVHARAMREVNKKLRIEAQTAKVVERINKARAKLAAIRAKAFAPKAQRRANRKAGVVTVVVENGVPLCSPDGMGVQSVAA